MKKDLSIIPEEVFFCLDSLHQQGFEAYIVGGCTRDFLRGKSPADWDLTTNATPEEIQKVFPDSFYTNEFLTVTARTAAFAKGFGGTRCKRES